MMPLPMPRKNEAEGDFTSRCMSDRFMLVEHPDEDQRAEVARNQWRATAALRPKPIVIRKTFETKLKMEPGERAVIARISTTAVDRDGDVMLPSGVDLKEFNDNPVVLFGHDSHRIPIGKAVGMKTRPNDIVAKVVFAERPASLPDIQEWQPDTIHEMFQQGVLKAFSVGFLIEDSRDANQKDIERFGEGARRIVTRWKLLEFSVVPIPANQQALAVAVSKGVFSDDSWTIEQIRRQMSEAESGGSWMICVPKPQPIEVPARGASG